MSHVLRVGVADQIAYFRAYNTDGSANTSLTASTTGLTLSVFRVGASSVSIASLSNKAADNTAHADGAIRNVGGNLYTIDLPDAACATQVPSICVRGSYTGGVIEGLEHPIVAYDPAQVAVGANTTAPPSASVNATAVRSELATELARLDASVSSRLASANYTAPPTAAANATQVRTELTTELARLDANVSTRLASSSYLAPPSASSIASAVQSQLNDDFASLASAIGDIDPGAVTVAPLSATRPTKVRGSNIETYVGDTDPIRIAIWSGASGTTPVDLASLRPLTLVIADKTSRAVIQTIADGDLDIDTTNYLTFTPSGLAVEEEAIHRWSLRKANGAVIGRGDFQVFWEPIEETE